MLFLFISIASTLRSGLCTYFMILCAYIYINIDVHIYIHIYSPKYTHEHVDVKSTQDLKKVVSFLLAKCKLKLIGKYIVVEMQR